MTVSIQILKVSHSIMKNYNYLVMDDISKDAVLIDPAWELDTIESALSEHHANLKGILVTHSHPDHVNLCGTLAERWEVPVFMSKTEVNYYNYSCTGLVADDSEDPFTCGTLRVIPHFTPGHTKGSVCYQIDNALFTGDTLFIEGCGMCVGKGASPYEMFNSLQKLKRKLATDTLIFPGHSYGQPCGKPLQFLLDNNLYLQFDNTETFASFRMRKPKNKANFFAFK